METKNKAKQLFHRLPSRLKFGIMQYVVMNLFGPRGIVRGGQMPLPNQRQ